MRRPLGTYVDEPFNLTIQPDGKLIVAGYSSAINFPGYYRINRLYYFTIVRFQSDGAMDTTFGRHDGMVTPFPGIAKASGLQTDGKIVAAGSNIISNDATRADFLLARYNADGTIDTTYNSTGMVTASFDNGVNSINALAIQPDNKAVVVGEASSQATGTKVSFLARYNIDGKLDASFASGTVSRIDIMDASSSIPVDVKLQGDGKIVVGGNLPNGPAFYL